MVDRSCERRRFRFAVILLAVFGPVLLGRSQGSDRIIPLGERVGIHSSVLEEDRELLVYLPGEYHMTTERFPVVYLLDGAMHFHQTTAIVQFLSRNQLMPRMIVIAVSNIDRDRDFTPTRSPDYPTSGGADAFLEFMKQDLFPFVEEHYRTHAYRVLIGHSLGGMFSVYTLLTHPGMFDAHIAISPWLHYDDGAVLRIAETRLPTDASQIPFVSVTCPGRGNEDHIRSIRAFERMLEARAHEGLNWQVIFMEHHNQVTLPLEAIYEGMARLFSDFMYPESLADSSLEVLRGHYAWLSEKYGYEVKGPEMFIVNLGYQALGEGRFEDAVALFHYGLELYPEAPNVHDSLGEAFEQAGRLEEAETHYALAVEYGKRIQHPYLRWFLEHLAGIKKKMKTGR